MDFGDFEITLREAVFSIAIASVMVAVGFLIDAKIEHHVNSKNMHYRQAIQLRAEERSAFREAVRTDIGNMFAEGNVRAVDKVTDTNIGGEYMGIRRDYQEYTRHTVTHTTTDSKGKTHTYTTHYWSWDTRSTKHEHSHAVDFNGVIVPYDVMRIGSCAWSGSRIVKISSHRRYVFHTQSTNFFGTAYCTANGGKIAKCEEFFCGMKLEDAYDKCTDSIARAVFWTLWTILTAGIVFGFVVLENRWIEDDEER